MASGFLILVDGRCLARRWWAYDAVVKSVADFVDVSRSGTALRDWLYSLLPGPEDEGHIGYGPWLRIADNQTVERYLDIRELTPENQLLFHDAALKAAEEYARSPEELNWPDGSESLLDLADMLRRADRGEPPLSRSEWRIVAPSEGRQIGPGW